MMVSKKRVVVFVSLIALAVLILLSGAHHYLTFENLQKNRKLFFSFVEQHYAASVFIFVTLYVMTAFVIPGTLILTAAAGFLFGFVAGTVYSLLAACFGATMAFLTSRYLIGSWIQKKYMRQLEFLNKEISRHGYNYLLVFRIVPAFPFFVVNYLTGMTHISKWTFLWTTAAGMLPGALVCTYAGQQLGLISSADEIFSTKVILSLLLLAILILIPPAVHHVKRLTN